MDTDRNLLFSVLTLQADLIDADRFATVCTLAAAEGAPPIADVLLQKEWLTADDRADVEKLLDRKLTKHGGDARAALAEVITDQTRKSLARFTDHQVRHSIEYLTKAPPDRFYQTLSDSILSAPPLTAPATASNPGTDSPYTLSRLHAAGGIGRVWLARDKRLGRDVALKELLPGRANNYSVWTRFLKEAQLTGQLEHPGIVPVYEVGRRPDESPYYTMRFVRGRTLAAAVAAYHERRQRGGAGPLELRELLGAFVGVCNAVAYAHSRGVLHRDLKPQNVVLGDFGEAIVLDWGLAKVMGQEEEIADPLQMPGEAAADATVQGQILGTPAYMAPEQAEGRLDRLGPATDVYGLGAILYEILTGRPPFRGNDMSAMLRQVSSEVPAGPRTLVPGVPAALEAVCLKALAKDPAGRYGKALELAADVQRWLADEPVTAYPEPWTVRARRWANRHRTLVTSVAATVVVAVASLAVATVLLKSANEREQRSRARAETNFQMARDAVDRYFTKVSGSAQLRAHGLEPLRADLLKQAREFYEQFLRDQPDDPGLRREMSRARLRLGRIEQAMGRYREAEEQFGQARAACQALHQEQPNNPAVAECLADSHSSLGEVYRDTNQWQKAEEAYGQALALCEALCQGHPGVPTYRLDLAAAHENLGYVYTQGGTRKAMAEQAYERALALYLELARAADAPPANQRSVANTYNQLGALHEDMGKLAQAAADFGHSREILQELVQKYPDDPDYLNGLASAYTGSAIAHTNLGDRKGSEGEFKQAIAAYEKLVRAHPAVLNYALDLAIGYSNLGVRAREERRLEEARDLNAKAIATCETILAKEPRHDYAGRVLHRSQRAEAGILILQGKYRQGAEQAEALAQSAAHWQDCYSLACLFALSSAAAAGDKQPDLAEKYAVRANEFLQKSLKKGLQNSAMLEQDSDFASLRSRADFQKTVRQVRESAKNAAGSK